jgi:hypothetical protein
MSSKKKPKKLRTPNVPAAEGRAGMAAATPATPRADPSRAQFDYTHVRGDLKRIAILAGSIFAGMVALAFFLR